MSRRSKPRSDSESTEEPAVAPSEVSPAPNPKASDAAVEYTGATLRALREAKGRTLQSIAEAIRISAAGIKAIEDEDYDRLPDARIYVRGYVSCLAEELGLDPETVLKTYLPRWERWYSSQIDSQKPHHR